MKRTVLGKRTNGGYGLYISIAGKDVDTITAPEDFVFNSDLGGAAVVHASGMMTMGSTVTFPALPYVPIVMSWGIPNTGTQQGTRITDRVDRVEPEPWWTGDMHLAFQVELSGPILEVTSSTVHFPFPPVDSRYVPFRTDYQAKYAVLRIPGGA